MQQQRGAPRFWFAIPRPLCYTPSMRRLASLVLTALALVSCEREQEEAAPAYTGQSAHWDQSAVPISLRCAACHQKEFEQWAASDHAWAWRKVDMALDSEPFHGQRLTAHGSELRFRTARDGSLLLKDSATHREFKVHSVLGRTPLVQYLVEDGKGGFHTPSAAWDVKRHEWFDMFSDDARLAQSGQAERKPGDWGHWLGRGMNWNSQCAWCHMSGFRKNYDTAKDAYASTWREPGVSCIQCHKLADRPDAGDGCMVAKGERKLSAQQVHDNCASCHARREEFDGEFTVGKRFDDHFRLELPLIEGIFWPNGMQRDEDYCETGLRLSRMGRTGVTCIDCHDPHTAALKLPQEDNSLCLRCHAGGTPVNGVAAPVIDMATHTPCPQGSKGARCVECHMPESPYMARDPRRDHSFNSPDPALSAELGTPNACLMCHTGKDNAWAAAAVERVYGKSPKMAAYRPRTRAVQAAMQGRGRLSDLLAAYRAEEVPAWRATLLEHMANLKPSDELPAVAREAAKDASPMVRAAAAKVLREEALPLSADPVKLVRRTAAWPLVDILLRDGCYPETLAELEATAAFQSDQPHGAMQLAVLADARAGKARRSGDSAAAARHDAESCRWYERAIELDPASPVARMDYAVHLARHDRPLDALSQMLACTAANPDNALAQYRLALILQDVSQLEPALRALDKAVRLDPRLLPARVNRAELLRRLGRHAEAAQEEAACRALMSDPA